jgi:phosphotransferase system HPr-like phosphotransfer protein
MNPIPIRLDLYDPDIFREFSTDMNSFRSDIDATSGSIHVDAKSLLAIVALGKPEFEVAIVSADPDEIRRFHEVIEKYEV